MLHEQLITFARVVELRSFTRAGDVLHLSQPAVTRQIAALEQGMDAVLIERAGRGIAVTAAGNIVYQYAKRIEAMVERCRVEVRELARPETGKVSIAAVTTVGLFTLPVLMKAFRTRYPLVRFQIWSGRTDGVLDKVLNGDADVGLLSTPIAHPRLECESLFDDPVVVVAAASVAAKWLRYSRGGSGASAQSGTASPTQLAASVQNEEPASSELLDPIRAPAHEVPLPPRPSLTLEQLVEEDMILYQAPSRFRTLVDGALEEAGIYPQPAMEFDSHEAVRAAALAGYGVAIVPQEAVQSDLASGDLVQLTVEKLPDIYRTTSLVLRRHAPRMRAVDNFVTLTRERYGHQPPLRPVRTPTGIEG